MSKSIIKDLFMDMRDFVEFNAHKRPQRNPSESESGLKEKLGPELMDLYNKSIGEFADNMAEEVVFYFAEGFKLGLLLGFECMEG